MRRNHSPGYHKTSSSLTSNIYNQQNVEQHSVLSAPIPQRQYIPPYQNHSQSSLPLEHQQPLHHQSQTYNSNTSSSNSSHTYSNDYSYPPPQQQQQSYSLLPSTSSTKGNCTPFISLYFLTPNFGFLPKIVASLLMSLKHEIVS